MLDPEQPGQRGFDDRHGFLLRPVCGGQQEVRNGTVFTVS
jgi:hypothetical protein